MSDPNQPAGPPPRNYPPSPTGGGTPSSDAKGFFGALFDFSFNSFVTPKIVKVVYILATIGLGLAYVGFVVVAFADGVGRGLLTLIVGALVVILYLALIRMTLEFYYAIVRMSQDINARLPRN